MRRNQDVPAKYLPPALHRRGVSKPISHYDLSAYLNSFGRFRFQRGQQNISIKKDTSDKFEVARQLLLFQVAPLFGLVQQLRNFFDSEIGGFHKITSYFPNLLFLFYIASIPSSTYKPINFSTKRI
jgi:hypothetical protein